jgi:GNAT superfamily N-acetyltransferase
MTTVKVVPIAADHRDAWNRLYAGYAAFYRVEQTAAMRDRVWSWLFDPTHEVNGFVALNDAGEPIGLTHYRPFARPLSASTGGFLDDLFVDETARGSGTADALINAVADVGRANGWTVIRWITAEDNARARKVYEL